MRVAYLGPPGTFSEEAVSRCAALADAERVPFPSFADAYEAALGGAVDVALLPVENSIEGAVGATLDLLAHRPGLRIQAELVLPVEQHLLARPGTEAGAIRRVLSHPQALGQCGVFLRTRLPGVPTEPTLSTADAARRASEEAGLAAIGGKGAAERYGLAVLESSIQDAAENFTRFVLLGRVDGKPTGRDRTSIAFTLDRDRPGGLYEVIAEFATRRINLSRIESRPTKTAVGHYVFFLDFEGHRAEPECADALAGVRRQVHMLLLLGSYPRA
ncbi:MAG TPA: prephenate dehydratase [Anaeromyxobacteraceae bacterium]|nr:prephenate dehydratase [Anaeromyxobacteraceae bacterium]